jgi:hypothetical protein
MIPHWTGAMAAAFKALYLSQVKLVGENGYPNRVLYRADVKRIIPGIVYWSSSWIEDRYRAPGTVFMPLEALPVSAAEFFSLSGIPLPMEEHPQPHWGRYFQKDDEVHPEVEQYGKLDASMHRAAGGSYCKGMDLVPPFSGKLGHQMDECAGEQLIRDKDACANFRSDGGGVMPWGSAARGWYFVLMLQVSETGRKEHVGVLGPDGEPILCWIQLITSGNAFCPAWSLRGVTMAPSSAGDLADQLDAVFGFGRSGDL